MVTPLDLLGAIYPEIAHGIQLDVGGYNSVHKDSIIEGWHLIPIVHLVISTFQLSCPAMGRIAIPGHAMDLVYNKSLYVICNENKDIYDD
jgi:hypothetical protein